MDKQTFLAALRTRLNGLPQREVEERLSFYSEMIDDRIEEGIPEAEAVADIGTVDQVFAQIVAEMPLSALVRERAKPNHRLGTREIVLLVLGAPIWISLLVAAFAVVLSVYASLWAAVISFWTVPVSLAAGALGGVLGAPLFWWGGNPYGGLSMLGAGLFCAGLTVFAHYACKAITRAVAILTKHLTIGIKRLLVGKGREA